ncbi:MAG: hypothetical protein C0468_05660 [Planctomyces sp.]|nr:hypothetical protein [Planctomyces sp.]MBA4120436.1 hypothetical protein [Isosphaera sp.]
MGKMKRFPPALAGPVYWLLRAGSAAAGVADLPLALSAARRLGRFYATRGFNRTRMSRAIENISVAFPGWGPAQAREMAVRAHEHLFMLAAEMIALPRLVTHEGWAGRVDLGGLEAAVTRLVSGRPTIMICGHAGNWEMTGYSMALLGFPVHALYRPLDLRPADRWVRQVRGRRGLVLVDKFGAAAMMPEIMRRGAPLGFVADQNAGDKGVFVPFFGRMASSYKAIAVLAQQFRAQVIVGAACRTGERTAAGLRAEPTGLNYRIAIEDTFDESDYAGQPDPVFYITARYRRAIERTVMRHPEQYLWMHRYWKSRPRWEHAGKPVPPAIADKLRSLPWMTDDLLARVHEHTRRDTLALAQAQARRRPIAAEDPPAAAPAG